MRIVGCIIESDVKPEKKVEVEAPKKVAAEKPEKKVTKDKK